VIHDFDRLRNRQLHIADHGIPGRCPANLRLILML
jgi:hypothetical protein